MSQVNAQIPAAPQPLTARETEVALLLAEGLGSAEIATRLSIAPSSAKWYLRQVFLKLGVHTRADAALRARQLALSVPVNAAAGPEVRPLGAIPRPVTSFIGRERETAALLSWLDSGTSGLLTITGAAGSGKTRLALTVAARAGQASQRQVYWTDLTATANPQLIGSTIASSLGVFIKPGQGEIPAIAEHLGDTPALLVLDNCEHLARDCAKASMELLAGCAGLRILATSRVPLPAEASGTWLLDPLPVPAAEDVPAEEIAASESVRLFTERASMVLPEFAVTRQNAVSVARVCRRLDGLPLAIELAASRVRILTTAQLAERLEGALGLLAGGGPVGAQRHATLRAALDWSHGLLPPPEQALFRRLSVFAGGWALEDAETVCPGGILEPADILPALSGLVDQSLVVVERPSGGTRRFRLLEVVRQYADEQLRAAEERSLLRSSHAARFAALAMEARGELNGPKQPAWTRRLEQDRGNLRAAMAWGLDEPDGLETGAEIAGALSQVWQLRGEFAEGLLWHRRYLASSHAIPRRLQADLHESTGFLAVHAGLGAEARSHWEEAAAIFAELQDPAAVGRQLHFLAHATMGTDALGAAALAARGLALEEEAGDQWWTSACLFALGDASFLQGDVDKAAECYGKSQVLARRLGHAFAIARRCVRLGQVARTRGNLEGARHHLGESLRVARDGNDDWGVTMALAAWASVAVSGGSPRASAMLLGAAQGRLDQYGAVLWALDRSEFDRTAAAATALVGEDAFRECLAAGRALTPEEIDALVKELREPQPPASDAGSPVSAAMRLTPREAQVLHLIAGGESNQSIAAGLGLSVRTVERHISNLYLKIGVDGPAARTAAANYAFRHGLGPEQDTLAVPHKNPPLRR
ncbi:LuxR C-terminal-related transcriptional regulator [Arthrobacter sp. S39]|uniref:ATP-binding protein n=1 Tax=Arthrobacter sp. S39 TaxID=2509720 RepID=UPI002417B7CA|nr:LuxR C-terminal-related transcriptional regulator [Arthrobacter sp. S39]